MKTGQAIRRGMRSYGRSLLSGSLLVCCMSCTDWIYEDRSGCDRGVYLNFRYDYNLQRADMFSDHVGGVTVYVPERGEHRRFRTAPGEGLPYASRSPCGRVPLRGAGHAEGGGGDAAGARGEVPDCRTRRREDGGAERHARPCSRRPRGTRRAAARYALARHESAQRRDVRSVRRRSCATRSISTSYCGR